MVRKVCNIRCNGTCCYYYYYYYLKKKTLEAALLIVLTVVKYIGCIQDTVYQDPSHLYNYSTKKCLHSDHLTLLHHISYAQ